MTTIKATIRNGRIEPDEPLNLPEGSHLLISLPDGLETAHDVNGLSQEEIDHDLVAMKCMFPLQMTDAELTAWEADRQAQKEWEKAQFVAHSEKLRRMWE